MRILVLDDNRDYAENLAEILETIEAVSEVVVAFDLASARDELARALPRIAFVDLDLPDGSGGDFIRAAHEHEPRPLCVILTGAGTMKSAIEAVDAGAFGFLTKDLPVGAILATARRAIEHLEAAAEREDLRQRLVEREHLAAIGQMAATLAHEIKNPLTGIAAALDVLLDAVEPPAELRELHEGIRRRFRDLDALVDDLLAFARPFEPDWSEFGAADLAERLRQGLGPQLAAGGEFSFRIAPGAERLRGDAVWLEAAVSNLLRNGLEAGAQRGRPRVELHVSRENGDALLDVLDEGPGIEEDHRERIFEPFFTTKTRGTGLGLAVTKRIVREHGGEIVAGDRPEGGGSRFRLRIPQEFSAS